MFRFKAKLVIAIKSVGYCVDSLNIPRVTVVVNNKCGLCA